VFVDLVFKIQCACVILSFVACPALQYFCALSHKRHNKKKQVFLRQIWFWSCLQLMSEKFFILRRKKRHTVKNTHTSSCKVPSFFSNFNETWIFVTDFKKNYANIDFHENPSSGSRVVLRGRKDRQTGMTNLITAFRIFRTRLKIVSNYYSFGFLHRAR